MEMAPDGKGAVGTGQFEKLKADSLVLAVGQHSDIEFLKSVPGIQIGRGDVVKVDASMSTGHPGIFAGGDLIGGARAMTTAVGHGKKAARNLERDRQSWRNSYYRPSRRPTNVPMSKAPNTLAAGCRDRLLSAYEFSDYFDEFA